MIHAAERLDPCVTVNCREAMCLAPPGWELRCERRLCRVALSLRVQSVHILKRESVSRTVI
jgi:hypothetical protein